MATTGNGFGLPPTHGAGKENPAEQNGGY